MIRTNFYTKRSKVSLFFLYVVFVTVQLLMPSGVFSQTIKCEDKTIKVKNFKRDTTFTFQNQFVASGKIYNIKDSKLPFEVRIYIVDANFPAMADIITLKGNGHTIRGSLMAIHIVEPRRRGRKDSLTKDGLHAIQVLANYQERTLSCEVVDSLVQGGIFDLESTNLHGFSKNTRGLMDAQSSYFYEVKIGRYLRNFSYVDNPNYDDPVFGRHTRIRSLLKYLLDNLKN